MKYTNTLIQERFNNEEQLKFLFFWGHQPNKDGSIGKSCFSQWWESTFIIDNVTYKTAEHYMMAGKARLFNDEEIVKEILETDHPHDAKKLGRKVRNFDPVTWNEHKYRIVYEGNLAKFSQNKELASFLFHTNDRIIVEASPRDRIWGIGMGQSNEKAMNPNLWRGHNLLGYVLMEVRDQLKK
ncbi:NADAR family protein [Tenacibaculum amylolyticum]|uniref:NADAR family protein n=1 Tax=Tenacibaculum amylolyticum TaxID=104269 RepID=UPI0038960410